MTSTNEAVARLLDNIARLLTLQHGDQYRIRAYTEASRTIEHLTDDITALYRAGQLETVEGIGPSIAARISDYLDTGHSAYEEQLMREIAPEASELLEIPSIGPARARLIHERLGLSTLADLEQAARDHRLRTLPGIGETLESRIAQEAADAQRQLA